MDCETIISLVILGIVSVILIISMFYKTNRERLGEIFSIKYWFQSWQVPVNIIIVYIIIYIIIMIITKGLAILFC